MSNLRVAMYSSNLTNRISRSGKRSDTAKVVEQALVLGPLQVAQQMLEQMPVRLTWIGHVFAKFVYHEANIRASPAGQVVRQSNKTAVLRGTSRGSRGSRRRSRRTVFLGEHNSTGARSLHWVAVLHSSTLKEHFHSVVLASGLYLMSMPRNEVSEPTAEIENRWRMRVMKLVAVSSRS